MYPPTPTPIELGETLNKANDLIIVPEDAYNWNDGQRILLFFNLYLI